jgi:hypothetical protein
VLLELQALKAKKVTRVRKAQRALQDEMVFQPVEAAVVPRAHKEFKENVVRKEFKVRKEIQAQGALAMFVQEHKENVVRREFKVNVGYKEFKVNVGYKEFKEFRG